MQTTNSVNRRAFAIDKNQLRKAIAEQNAKIGFLPDLNATTVQTQRLMQEQGVRAEDNIGSYAILAER
jgi:hypothetical protein